MQNGAKEDIATFRVDRTWFAARTRQIVETIDGSNIVSLPGMPVGMLGCVNYRESALPVIDLAKIVERAGAAATRERPPGQIVVMTLPNETRFGVLVDDLGEIVEVLASRLAPLPAMMVQQKAFADTAITHGGTDDSNLLILLSAERLCENLAMPAGQAAPSSAAETPNETRAA
jgi:purine-binding chemotaxis protein CheW